MVRLDKMAELHVKLFADGADLATMRELATHPWIQGFTTKKISADPSNQVVGQGLYISRHIVVSLHKGEMILLKNEGNRKGAHFLIMLPLAVR